MKINSFSLERKRLRFSAPFTTSVKTFITRDVIFVKLFSDNRAGTGEISPLPYIGSEDLPAARRNAAAICNLLIRSGETELNQLYLVLNKFSFSPAAVSGVEQALLSLFLGNSKTAFEKHFSCKIKNSIRVNAVFSADLPKSALQRAKKAADASISVFKLKVGVNSLKSEINTLSLIRSRFGDGISIRLDANGMFTPSEALRRAERYAEFGIEYIEQPVADIEELRELKKDFPLKIALDESLKTLNDIKRFIDEKTGDVFIIKPSVLGSIRECLKAVRMIERAGKKVVITHSLDSATGLKKAVLLARMVKSNVAQGVLPVEFTNNAYNSDNFTLRDGRVICTRIEMI